MPTEWKQYRGGLEWRVLDDGRIETRGQGVTMTRGYPHTLELMFKEYGDAIRSAAKLLDVPVPWIVGMIPVEAARQPRQPRRSTWEKIKRLRHWNPLAKARSRFGFNNISDLPFAELPGLNHLRMDPVSLRLEPGHVNQYDTPARLSGGLPQILFANLLMMGRKHGAELRFTFRAADGAEVSLPVEFCIGDTMDPERGLVFMAMFYRHIGEQYLEGVEGHAFDFVHLTGAYNAGAVLFDDANPYHLLAYDPQRTVKAVAYHNDCYRPEILPYWRDCS